MKSKLSKPKKKLICHLNMQFIFLADKKNIYICYFYRSNKDVVLVKCHLLTHLLQNQSFFTVQEYVELDKRNFSQKRTYLSLKVPTPDAGSISSLS